MEIWNEKLHGTVAQFPVYSEVYLKALEEANVWSTKRNTYNS